MSKAAFEERWAAIEHGRKQGLVELSDFLGSYDVLPLIDLGLLEKTHEPHPFERYQGCAPTAAGGVYMTYDHRRQLILVRSAHVVDLYSLLMQEVPGWDRMTFDGTRDWTNHPVYDPGLKHRKAMEDLVNAGYITLAAFWRSYQVEVDELIAGRFCEYRLLDGESMVYALQPTDHGEEFLFGPPRMGALLVKPDKVAELFVAVQDQREARLGATG